MKFFFPDSQDQVDPSFDFETETRSETRIRQRDDLYAHEVFDQPPYDGILVSKSMVDKRNGSRSRYTLAQRHRFSRLGARRFFRMHSDELKNLQTMGDCGAFSYVDEEKPPYTPEEVAEFYDHCGFNFGVSVDHVILKFSLEADHSLPAVDPIPQDCRDRQDLTLELADEFLRLHKARSYRFTPVGVAQGWSPQSYAHSVEKLQEMGFEYIGLGGLVPMKTHEILRTLEAIADVRAPKTKLHLFGISRCEHATRFQALGVASIDSTSPFRKAFKSAKDNYYATDRTYSAIRVPQVDANTKLGRQVKAGEIDQDEARSREQACLDAMRSYGSHGNTTIDEVLEHLVTYERFIGRKKNRIELYRETLENRPWEECTCHVCQKIGIDVVLFRGSERNKRRGFHNLFVFNQQLKNELRSTE
jgi:hypothetical protein